MRPFVTIVTGLPRAGTSLLMRMLAAGGLGVVVDGGRAPDDDNPHGYFEDARVTTLPTTAAWIGEACGRAVKIVAPLLRHLPPEHDYRIVFVQRDLDEVLASQRTMLARRGAAPPPDDDVRMRGIYERHLARVETWLAQQPRMRVLAVEYAEVLARPGEHAARIAAFLEGGLDVEAMAQAVDVRLYRHRR